MNFKHTILSIKKKTYMKHYFYFLFFWISKSLSYLFIFWQLWLFLYVIFFTFNDIVPTYYL